MQDAARLRACISGVHACCIFLHELGALALFHLPGPCSRDFWPAANDASANIAVLRALSAVHPRRKKLKEQNSEALNVYKLYSNLLGSLLSDDDDNVGGPSAEIA